jgi:ABC-type antimicrobial peptide transport system permease subunit
MSRTRELGIRRALGATAGSLRLSILRRGAVWSAAGLVIGGGAAAIIARALDTMLFGVAPTDARTFLSVVVIVAAATVLACVIPARRAVGVDPIVAMQVE